MAVEAALALLIARDRTGRAGLVEVGLAEAARWFARPIGWRMTGPGDILGGGHAGYRVYRCRDGQVAAAALEPHFARCLFQLAGLPPAADPQAAATRDTLAAWFRDLGCAEIAALAGAHDLPLHAMPDRATPAD
jgi:crotonobetainyl-CoA:carnitine CoA-transferase CaiB-like acyl-CoA transferase